MLTITVRERHAQTDGETDRRHLSCISRRSKTAKIIL